MSSRCVQYIHIIQNTHVPKNFHPLNGKQYVPKRFVFETTPNSVSMMIRHMTKCWWSPATFVIHIHFVAACFRPNFTTNIISVCVLLSALDQFQSLVCSCVPCDRHKTVRLQAENCVQVTSSRRLLNTIAGTWGTRTRTTSSGMLATQFLSSYRGKDRACQVSSSLTVCV
jgi:hypothetical protein